MLIHRLAGWVWTEADLNLRALRNLDSAHEFIVIITAVTDLLGLE